MSHAILTDEDTFGALPTADVVATVELAFEEQARGTLVAPPRWRVGVGDGALVFTAGAATELGAVGFRVYETLGRGPDHTQLVAVFDAGTGAFEGLLFGHAVGLLRTGGIGGVAVEHLARPGARELAVLGSGPQARSQLEAAAAVREFEDVRIFSPTPEHREELANRMDGRLDSAVRAVGDAESAVRGADVVACATDSDDPVLEADWLAPGTHVTTLGPKFEDAHELPLAVLERADVLVTDSVAQADAYDRPFFIAPDRLTDLGPVVADDAPGRAGEDDLTVFCSVGLAGTEVVLAEEILRREG